MPNSRPLENMQCLFISRTWMKRSKAFRVRLELPDDLVLAAVLTNMVEQQVDVVIQGEEESEPVTITPACIVDIPQKGTRWHIELETVSEGQNGVGAQLTLLSGQAVQLTLHPVGEAPVKEERGDVTAKTLKGLHVSLFPSPEFQRFLGEISGTPVEGQDECKATFKSHMGVESCRGLKQEQVGALIDQFNTYIQDRREPC